MKVIKLNRRFKVHKEQGHKVAVRFYGYHPKASELEKVCQARLGENYIWNPEGTWYGWFGKNVLACISHHTLSHSKRNQT